MQKFEELPRYSAVDQFAGHARHRRRHRRAIRMVLLLCVASLIYTTFLRGEAKVQLAADDTLSIDRLAADHRMCAKLRHQPQDPHGLRGRNARWVEGQKPVLIRNATVWTGEPVAGVTAEEARRGKGFEWVRSDVLLENGLIARVERNIRTEDLPSEYDTFDAKGRQLTSGIIDMHSHAGVDPLPSLRGSSDVNEMSEDITPYVRSLDGFNPLDPHLEVVKSGGVTTSLILPGSGNNMGGEAFVVKLSAGKDNGRPELSAEDMLADPERNWRYMKMACGENPKSVYGKSGRGFGPYSRLGEAWFFRHALEQATSLKNAQDDWCDAADRVGAQNMRSYLPMDLKWESLSAALRGQVMINTHCYTVPDLEMFVGLTNEFNFSVRAFHHAHQTYLVPEILKHVYGGRPPAAALFADNMNYKAESYVASEQAGQILYDAGITPVYVSDNPVLNSQHVLVEAAKAYKNGLMYHVALAGVTSAPAELLGLGERIGKVKAGFDADVVVWDSDPLSLGATPVQVFIDGIPQIKEPVELVKPIEAPMVHLKHSAVRVEQTELDSLAISGISSVLIAGYEEVTSSHSPANVVIINGTITCVGACVSEMVGVARILQLENGYLTPALTAFGSLLGLEEIAAERDTFDGANDQSSFSAAVDGLTFNGKNLAAAFAHGVTRAITAPASSAGGHKGLSAGFRLAAAHALEKDAVFSPEVALHYTLTPGAKGGKTPSFSSAIADLKAKLLRALKPSKTDDDEITPEDAALKRVLAGSLPLVVDVHSADAIAALLRLKSEIDHRIAHSHASSGGSNRLRLVILGGAESHLLAAELAAADVAVILAPVFSYAATWDQRRALSGAPRSRGTAIDVLHAAGVRVALGVDEDWEARDLFVQAGTVLANGEGRFSEKEALALAAGNLYEILGLQQSKKDALREFVVFEGSPLTTNGQLRVVAGGLGKVNIWS